jgi:uncharacterized protein YggE
MKTFSWAAITFGLIGFLAQPVTAQYGRGDGVVGGSGTVSIERMPEGMRMNIVLTAKGKDLKEALAALKDRTDAAKAQLATLGADKASVKTESAQISAGKNNQQRQMEMMMAQRIRGGGAKKPKKEEKPQVSVSTALTANWPLKAKETEELLIATHALQDKIKAADLGGNKDAKLSPEEEEAFAEMEENGYTRFGDEGGPKPGEPTFLFYTAITDTEREKALGEAFKKAKEKAARVAKAAGSELGKLASLTESEVGMDSEDYPGSMYGNDPYAYQMMQRLRRDSVDGSDSGSAEGIGIQPGKVSYNVTVHASFDLKAP